MSMDQEEIRVLCLQIADGRYRNEHKDNPGLIAAANELYEWVCGTPVKAALPSSPGGCYVTEDGRVIDLSPREAAVASAWVVERDYNSRYAAEDGRLKGDLPFDHTGDAVSYNREPAAPFVGDDGGPFLKPEVKIATALKPPTMSSAFAQATARAPARQLRDSPPSSRDSYGGVDVGATMGDAR